MALSTNGKISLYCFCLTLTVVILPVFSLINRNLEFIITDYWLIISVIYSGLLHGLLVYIYKPRGYAYKVAWRAGLLGSGFGISILISTLANSSWSVFGWYLTLLTFFHYSEYLTTAMTNPKFLSLDSFLLNHSKEYGIAAFGSFIEFMIERFFCPEMKQILWLSIPGLLLCIGGEIIRKVAMFTAGTNFNHIIQSHREEGHVLVVHGIYSLFRHPAYVGWFWWSIGTQMILCNPICFIGYVVVSWRFFNRRILEEEITLLNFFGEDYVKYQKRVHTGLPFIKGYRLEL